VIDHERVGLRGRQDAGPMPAQPLTTSGVPTLSGLDMAVEEGDRFGPGILR
jgi:hypothetical protein